jgi:hypothetical protein
VRNLAALEWIDSLVLTRDIVTPGDRNVFFDRVHRGEFVNLRRGVYIDASEWSRLDLDAKQRMRIKAVVAFADRDFVVSHQSAVAMWRLPWVGERSRLTDVLSDFAAGGRSSSIVRRHAIGLPQVTERIEGVRVTALARTVVDIATEATFEQSVVVADAALRRSTRPVAGLPPTELTSDDLLAELELVAARHGNARARRAIEFADGSADRPGESLSRVNMSVAHLRMPLLQVPLVGASGRRWVVDFFWPDFNLIGEFDGHAKYTDPEFLRGRTPEQALRDEKFREDDLRAAGHGMSRWGWDIGKSMPALRDHLVRAGVR